MYDYQTQRPNLFTEEGQVLYTEIRDNVKTLLLEAGAVRSLEAMKGASGDTWTMLACLDRMVELKEIIEITKPGTMGQYRIFTKPYSDC